MKNVHKSSKFPTLLYMQHQWRRQNLQVGVKLSRQRCEDQGAEGMGCGEVRSGGAQPPPQKFFFTFSPINGAIWCTFSTFVSVTMSLPYTPPHFFSSDFHESHDRVWYRLGGGSCPQLPLPVTTLLCSTVRYDSQLVVLLITSI